MPIALLQQLYSWLALRHLPRNLWPLRGKSMPKRLLPQIYCGLRCTNYRVAVGVTAAELE